MLLNLQFNSKQIRVYNYTTGNTRHFDVMNVLNLNNKKKKKSGENQHKF